MSAWIFLGSTVACLALTLDAFRLGAPLKDQPFRFSLKEWRRDMEHLPLAEQERIYRSLQPSILGPGVLAWLFLAMTVLLASLTTQAFIG